MVELHACHTVLGVDMYIVGSRWLLWVVGSRSYFFFGAVGFEIFILVGLRHYFVGCWLVAVPMAWLLLLPSVDLKSAGFLMTLSVFYNCRRLGYDTNLTKWAL